MAEQHEKALVPQIRFTGFTDPWEQRKLGQHLKLSRELGHTGVDARKLTVKLWGKGVVEKTDLYGGSAQTQYYIRHAGQFMYGKLDFLHAAFGVVPDKLDCFESTLDSPAFDIEGLDSSFLLNLVTQEDFYLKNGNIANGSRKAKRIHEETFLNMEIRAPELVEQRRIGAFLDRLDSLITLHQRKYDKLCVLKKSMLDKMFPKGGSLYPEIRFAGFTDPWEQRKLGELTEIKDSARIPNRLWREAGVPYIRASDISQEDLRGALFIDEEDYAAYKAATGAPEKGDVLFNGGGEIGKAIINGNSSPIYVQGGAVLYARIAHSSLLDARYLVAAFVTQNVVNAIGVLSAGGTMKHFTLQPAKNLPIEVPSIAEQRRIGAFFDRLDSLITLHQRKLELLRNIKKSMLDKMFV